MKPLCRFITPALLLCLTTVGCTPKQTDPAETEQSSHSEAESATEQLDPPKDFGEGYTQLTMTDFQGYSVNENAWKHYGDRIVTNGATKGYIYTKGSYKNFILTLEYRFEPPVDADEKRIQNCNTGVLLYVQEPHKVWPVSLEVQGKFVEMGSIKPNGGAADVVIEDHPEVRESKRKPVGEWNHFEIHSTDGALQAFLNGELICKSEAGELKSGVIGLQSEGDMVEFRYIAIKPLDTDTTPPTAE